MIAVRHLAACALALLPAAATGGDGFERLFLSPAERRALDLGSAPEHAPPAPPPSVRVHGIVRRDHGPTTIWIDHQPTLLQPPLRLETSPSGLRLRTADGRTHPFITSDDSATAEPPIHVRRTGGTPSR